ncbi:MAG: hypothetical protein QFB86_01775 [Patescibacteria group bacterium]|nr:hypothetical protein [Patescibacteria group bacterium]
MSLLNESLRESPQFLRRTAAIAVGSIALATGVSTAEAAPIYLKPSPKTVHIADTVKKLESVKAGNKFRVLTRKVGHLLIGKGTTVFSAAKPGVYGHKLTNDTFVDHLVTANEENTLGCFISAEYPLDRVDCVSLTPKNATHMTELLPSGTQDPFEVSDVTSKTVTIVTVNNGHPFSEGNEGWLNGRGVNAVASGIS